MPDDRELLDAHLTSMVNGAPPDWTPREPAPDLEAMLRVARRLHNVAAISPSPLAAERIRGALRGAPAAHARQALAWQLGLRRPAVALVVAVALAAMGTTSVLAAPAALPDSPLYSLRSLRESVEVGLASGPQARAALYATFARERAVQLARLAKSNGSTAVGTRLLQDLRDRIYEAKQEAHSDGQAAASTLQQFEGQIGNELKDVQQSGGFSGELNQQLDQTIHDVQSGQSGQSGQDANGAQS